MRCTLATMAVVCVFASAAAQDRPPKLRSGIESDELKRLEHPLLRPEAPRPDTSLIDDTRASGLQPRLIGGEPPQPWRGWPLRRGETTQPPHIRSEPPKPEGLPIGRHCVVYTVDGREFRGLLLLHGKWLFLHQAGDGRKTWIAMDHVVAIEEIGPPARRPLLNGHESP